MASTPTPRAVIWPLIGTLVFIVTVPGTVVVVIPYLLSGWTIQPPFFGGSILRGFGVALILGGLPLFLDFVTRFVWEGRGTPAPIAPTQFLVKSGAYRYVRNPGYVAVIALIAGQGLFFGSRAVLLYLVVVALAFHLFVVLYEEPTLRRQFGKQYEAYCRAVPRWIPRPTPATDADLFAGDA